MFGQKRIPAAQYFTGVIDAGQNKIELDSILIATKYGVRAVWLVAFQGGIGPLENLRKATLGRVTVSGIIAAPADTGGGGQGGGGQGGGGNTPLRGKVWMAPDASMGIVIPEGFKADPDIAKLPPRHQFVKLYASNNSSLLFMGWAFPANVNLQGAIDQYKKFMGERRVEVRIEKAVNMEIAGKQRRMVYGDYVSNQTKYFWQALFAATPQGLRAVFVRCRDADVNATAKLRSSIMSSFRVSSDQHGGGGTGGGGNVPPPGGGGNVPPRVAVAMSRLRVVVVTCLPRVAAGTCLLRAVVATYLLRAAAATFPLRVVAVMCPLRVVAETSRPRAAVVMFRLRVVVAMSRLRVAAATCLPGRRR